MKTPLNAKGHAVTAAKPAPKAPAKPKAEPVPAPTIVEPDAAANSTDTSVLVFKITRALSGFHGQDEVLGYVRELIKGRA